jgi:transposase-like protein
MTVRDIQAHLGEIYEVEVSPDLISRITDGSSTRSRTGRPARSIRCIR